MNGGQHMLLADTANHEVRLEGVVPGAGIEPAWQKPADFKGALVPSPFNGLRRFVRQNFGGSLLYYSRLQPPGRTFFWRFL